MCFEFFPNKKAHLIFSPKLRRFRGQFSLKLDGILKSDGNYFEKLQLLNQIKSTILRHISSRFHENWPHNSS
jgi:hypothetical protein